MLVGDLLEDADIFEIIAELHRQRVEEFLVEVLVGSTFRVVLHR